MTPADLRSGEEVVHDADELQWRQVHPNWLSGEVVSGEAFTGTSEARAEVSTVRSSAVSADEATDHHTTTLGLSSAGSWAVSVAEVSQSKGRVVDDAACVGVTTPGHSYIDMRGMTKTERKLARATLAAQATSRGRC